MLGAHDRRASSSLYLAGRFRRPHSYLLRLIGSNQTIALPSSLRPQSPQQAEQGCRLLLPSFI